MICIAQKPVPASACTAPLIEYYWRIFEGIEANTPRRREAAYRLRYRVFCLERKIFDPAGFPDGLECDEYDKHSLHALLRHRRSHAIAGAIRLVLHRPGAAAGSLPFHRVCRDLLAGDPSFLPFETLAEIGRFAISKSFRRRHGDGEYGGLSEAPAALPEPRRLIPHMTLGLMTTALRLSMPHRIRHVCAVMEPTLLRLLRRFGIRFEPLGQPVEYYGLRQPCYADLAELLARCAVERPEIWRVITDRGRLAQGGPIRPTAVPRPIAAPQLSIARAAAEPAIS
jgi:N-acyl amino acid synthase of PEP-CTERM/exosortase system